MGQVNTTDVENKLYTTLLEKFEVPLTKQEVKLIVEDLLEILISELSENGGEGNKVLLRNFGTFTTKTRKGRKYVVKGEEVEVGDRLTVTFKPGTGLKESIS